TTSPLLERIARAPGREPLERERLVRGLHRDLEEAPRAPPQRLEHAVLSAVGHHLVREADEALALELVAVALEALLLRQRLLVRQPDAGARASRQRELGVGRDQLAPVEKQRGLR